jgi:hypothetical protein
MASMTHDPCCSSHGIVMDCARYRRTHFVEVRPCCTDDTHTTSYAAEIADADYALRQTAASYGIDPDVAVQRAQTIARETVLGPLMAMDRVRWQMSEEWLRRG